jgi:hypothetical protein
LNCIWVQALLGLMHLGLKTGPLCPMFYTKLKEPSSFSDVADGLCIYFPNILWVQRKEHRYVCLSESKASVRLKILMTSGSKKGTQIYFSLKSPGKRTPPGSPTGPLWRGRPVYRAFCISLKNLIFRVPQ